MMRDKLYFLVILKFIELFTTWKNTHFVIWSYSASNGASIKKKANNNNNYCNFEIHHIKFRDNLSAKMLVSSNFCGHTHIWTKAQIHSEFKGVEQW